MVSDIWPLAGIQTGNCERSLFELRSVPLDLFHQGGSNALDQPNAIRGHGQEPLGRELGEATLIKKE